MPKLYILIGAPASGKTTRAKELVNEGNGNVVRVNQDDIREMAHTGEWSKHKERATKLIKAYAIHGLLASGFDVVVDDTNIEPSVRAALRATAKEVGAEVVTEIIQIDYGQAVLRDKQRGDEGGRSVGEAVIKKFYLRALELDLYRD